MRTVGIIRIIQKSGILKTAVIRIIQKPGVRKVALIRYIHLPEVFQSDPTYKMHTLDFFGICGSYCGLATGKVIPLVRVSQCILFFEKYNVL